MNSGQEESADQLDESNAVSSSSVDQSFDQKGNGPREHAKPRRRRRGKKRKQKKESAATCEAENPEECESELHAEREHETHEDSECPGWDSEENLSCDDETYSDVILRPINVPSAPLNSTQFIIDDHNDCRFYMSFETPNPYGGSTHADSHCDGVEGDIIEPIGDDAAYIDIDYQYESPQDFDNTAYYDQDFELSYKNSRFEDLLRLSRTELISRLQSLESRFKELTEDLVKENPSPILEKLQAELLELQEKNSYLKESNSKLTTVLQDEADHLETRIRQTIAERVAISSVSHDEHESEDSDREVYEECNEPDEVIMSDLNADSDTVKDIFGKNCDIQISHSERIAEPRESVEDHIGHSGGDHVEVDVDCHIECNEVNREHLNEQVVVGKDQHELDGNVHFLLGNQSKSRDNKSSSELKTGSLCSSTTISNSEGIQTKHVHSNSHKMHHCQPNNLVNDELRTLNISTSELFHITNQTKCSSLVPVEGGMSPSETSVN